MVESKQITENRASAFYNLKVSSVSTSGKATDLTTHVRLELQRLAEGWRITSHATESKKQPPLLALAKVKNQKEEVRNTEKFGPASLHTSSFLLPTSYFSSLSVIGALYEAYFRPDTYHHQDQRLIYGDLVATIVRAKVMEFCAAGGVEDPEFRTVSNPEQIISEKELARLNGREERDEGKRGGAGGSGREGGVDRHGKGGKSG